MSETRRSTAADKPRLVLVSGLRTPFSRFQTEQASMSATDLARASATALMLRLGMDPAVIDEVIYGCVSQPIDSANPARISALRSGVPERVPAATVQRNCASGLEAVLTAHQRMAADHGDVFLTGGMESMSQIPLYYSAKGAAWFQILAGARSWHRKARALLAFRPGLMNPVSGLQLGLTDPVTGRNMGETAEILAREFAISRADQDTFAVRSHHRAAAQKEFLAGEITPAYPLTDSVSHAVTEDNGIRPDTDTGQLGRLKPVFDRRGGGTVTAGNSSQISDGAVSLIVAREDAARAHGWPVMARIIDYAVTGCDPLRMGLGPVKAMAEVCTRTGLALDEFDVIEINEAFAAQVLAVCKAVSEPEAARMAGLNEPLGRLDPAQVNRNGGAIALGHPVGASGARLLLTAARQLRAAGKRYALVSLCIGGGQGAAIVIENRETS